MTPDDTDGERPAAKNTPTRKSYVITGGIVLAVFVVAGVLFARGVSRVRVTASRMVDIAHLKQSALASHGYAGTNGGGLVGPYAQVSPGVLNTEMSFRVSLLPYMEQDVLYKQIDLRQPWDSVKNGPMTSIPLKVFQSPDTLDATKPDTPYRVFYGGGALFEADGKPVKLTDIPDGASNTILFVHATETVPWAKPQEFAYTPTTPLPPLGSPGLGKGFNAAMADGSVRFFKATIPDADLRSLIEKADGRAADIE